jgi:uncharacterized protein (DUF302 family)
MMFIGLTHRDEAHARTGIRGHATPPASASAVGRKLNPTQGKRQRVDPHLLHPSVTTAAAGSCSIMRGYETEATMKKVLGIAAVVLSLSAFAFADESGLLDKNAGIITKPSKFSVTETMDRVEAAAKGVGANIFARIDYQQMSKKVNVDIRPNQLLIFGRGAGGPYIIKEAPLAGIDVPFKALVWEDSQGKVWVSHTNGSFIDKRYAVKGAASYVKNIDETIEKIISEALN